MSTAELKRAVKKRSFLGLCQKLLPAYHEHFPEDRSPKCTLEELRAAAIEGNCVSALEDDLEMAPLALNFRASVKSYAANGGMALRSDENCELWITRNRGKENQYEQKVSSALIVAGEGYNSLNVGSCLHIVVRSTAGIWNELLIPRAELVGGANLQGRLQDAGMLPGDWKVLLHLFQNIDPPRKFIRLESAGWNGEFYAMPSGLVIPLNEDAIATFPPVPNFVSGGTFEGAQILLRAIESQSRLQFAVMAGYAAPILAHYGPEAEPGGFHYYGPSSRGKTTLLTVAASIWGRGAELKDGGIVGSWNTTGFAAEHTAAQHSDCAMFLDELKAADPEQFAKLCLQLSNGAGKRAGTSSGQMRETKVFRPMVSSTGEISAKQYITDNRLPYHAGMSVRMVDVPAETGSGFGIFDSVPDNFPEGPGSYARWLKLQAATHYGHHGPRLVEYYVADRPSFLSEVREAARTLRDLLDQNGGNSDPQTGRVCDRFSFVGAVSLVACAQGLLPWQAASVTNSVLKVFDAWFQARGGVGSQEGLAAERSFTAFFYAHQDRFDGSGAVVVRNRIGLIRRHKTSTQREVFIAHDQGFAEMLGGQYDQINPFVQRVREGLSDDWELVMSGGRPKRDTPSNSGLPKRCYCFREKRFALEADNDDTYEFDEEDVG